MQLKSLRLGENTVCEPFLYTLGSLTFRMPHAILIGIPGYLWNSQSNCFCREALSSYTLLTFFQAIISASDEVLSGNSLQLPLPSASQQSLILQLQVHSTIFASHPHKASSLIVCMHFQSYTTKSGYFMIPQRTLNPLAMTLHLLPFPTQPLATTNQ